jgi:N-methylhydantoinase A
MGTYFVGADTGGTFTDVVIVDALGAIAFDKAFSTPLRPGQGTLAALDNAARRLGWTTAALLPHTARFAHGTTVGTNALIERRGARVGLVMTRGFEDTTLITRGPMGKNLGIPIERALDFIHTERPAPLVPRALIRGVAERVCLDGTVLAPLDLAAAQCELEELLRAGVESLAVCLLWSFRNGQHEQQVRELVRALAPDVPVSLSSEVSPQIGEFERAMTTTVNAYIGPVLERYVRSMQADLAERGLGPTLQVLQASGGATLPQHVEKQAVSLINSGPVGGLVAARYMGQALGHRNVITSDMGGTSFDVSVIHEGRFEYDPAPFLAHGLPVQTPALKVVTVGAGGGSIASSDGHRLLVGPRSAGANPGPACYGAGGTEPTVTDALVVLGILDPDRFFGGRKQLDRRLAEEAIVSGVGRPLGLGALDAAAAIYAVVTAKMSDLIRKVTVESGYDPRDFALMAYGGASPAHAVLYAEPLGVQEVIVPWASSVFSALGCALSDIKYAYARSEPMLLDDSTEFVERFEDVFRGLEATALDDLRVASYREADVLLTRSLDMRYEGQMSELSVPWIRTHVADAGPATVRQCFDERYRAKYGAGADRAESPVEIITFRVEALKVTDKPVLHAEPEHGPDSTDAQRGRRRIDLRHTGALDAQVYDGERLVAGNVAFGPALVERRDTTILVPPGYVARMDQFRNIRLRKQA